MSVSNQLHSIGWSHPKDEQRGRDEKNSIVEPTFKPIPDFTGSSSGKYAVHTNDSFPCSSFDNKNACWDVGYLGVSGKNFHLGSTCSSVNSCSNSSNTQSNPQMFPPSSVETLFSTVPLFPDTGNPQTPATPFVPIGNKGSHLLPPRKGLPGRSDRGNEKRLPPRSLLPQFLQINRRVS